MPTKLLSLEITV